MGEQMRVDVKQMLHQVDTLTIRIFKMMAGRVNEGARQTKSRDRERESKIMERKRCGMRTEGSKGKIESQRMCSHSHAIMSVELNAMNKNQNMSFCLVSQKLSNYFLP